METFSNVFQPPDRAVRDYDFFLKGQWNRSFFRNDHPVILELGCGKGEYTTGLAGQMPERNYIGMDIKGSRIWKGAKYALENGLHNVAFIRARIEWVESFFAQGEITEIWLLFPDPQEKRKRQKKRLTTPRFLRMYRNIMVPGGTIHLKTDHPAMYHYTRSVARHNGFPILAETEDLYAGQPGDPALNIITFYENRHLAEGRKTHYLSFRLSRGREITEPETL